MKTAQQRADELEKRLLSLDKHDPNRESLKAELRFWRHKALRIDVRNGKRRAA